MDITINDQLVKEFFSHAVQLQEHEVFVMVGGARKKYALSEDELSTSHEVITRKVIRSNDPDRFLNYVKDVYREISHGVDRKTEKTFPPYTLMCYYTVNPSSTIGAYIRFKDKMDKHLHALILHEKGSEHWNQNMAQMKKMHIHLESMIHGTLSRKPLGIADIDRKSSTILFAVLSELREHVKYVTETRGGYHVIYGIEGNEIVYEKKQQGLKHRLQQQFGEKIVEFHKGVQLTPIWGTPQGGFMVQPVKDWKDIYF